MSLHLWEAVNDADARSQPLFDIHPAMATSAPPSLQRVLVAAAALWCRTLVWPTVREIASTAAVAASTSINAVGSSAGLRRLLLESERHTIVNLVAARFEDSPPPADAVASAFRSRVERLASIEAALATLPFLAGIALEDQPMAFAGMGAYAGVVHANLGNAPIAA